MYEKEYRKLVLDEFEKKLATGVLPPELIAPTRSSLRDHCISVCKERYQKKDEPLLKSFYGERENPAAYLIAVQNCDPEAFRTLNNFLGDRSKGTSFKNISMLAWMIDFEPRPFREDLKMPLLLDTEIPSTGSPEPAGEPPLGEPPSEPEVPQPATEGDNAESDNKRSGQEISTEPPPSGKKRWPWLAALLLVIAVTYYFISHNPPPLTEGCMVWTGEQYRSVTCDYKPEDHTIPVIALDTTVLKHFKKIMKDDTLTANSVDKVWCVKIDGRYEYYTDSAAHPLHPEKILRHLTQYIMNNNPPSGK